ncbi:MAG: hypothetical protein ACFFEN_08735 [Candidatus Thorarchaeota archaeon]
MSKVRDVASVLLTTSEDILNFGVNYRKLKFLVYNESDNFKYYIIKVLTAYRIGYKENYSNIIFSIDPGSKRIGLVVFIDDYYLISQTFYDKTGIIDFIKDYIICFQIDNPNVLTLTFKFGSGVLPLTINLIEEVFNLYQNRMLLKIYLIDESKSSKIKIQDIKKKFRTKHELSALILALRNGVEIRRSELFIKFNQKRFHDPSQAKYPDSRGEFNNSTINIQELIEKLVNDEISLSESSVLFQ